MSLIDLRGAAVGPSSTVRDLSVLLSSVMFMTIHVNKSIKLPNWFASHVYVREYFTLVPPCCWTPKMVYSLESLASLLYKLRYTTLHMYFRFMAAMFDLSVTPTSESIHVSCRAAGPQRWGSLSEIWWFHVRITTSHLHPVWRPAILIFSVGVAWHILVLWTS